MFKVLNFLIGGFIFVISVAVDLDFLEEVEEGLLLHFFRLLLASLLLVLLLDDLHCDVLALLPLDHIALALFDDLSLKHELLVQFLVEEPLVLREIEVDPECLEVL